MKPIRVLHVIDHLGYGGAPIAVKGIVENIDTNKFDIIVCALRTNPIAIPLKAKLTSLKSSKYNPKSIFAINRICRENHIDIIHAHLRKSIITSLVASIFCKSKIIIQEHGDIFQGGTGYFYRFLLRFLGNRAAKAIVNSQAAQTALLKTGLHREKISVISNFIDFDRFDFNRHDRKTARNILDIQERQIAIGFVGRLDYYKGADILIDAAALLCQDNDTYRFYIVGEGKEREHLEKQIQIRGLTGKVTLIGLYENPAEIMRGFDIGIIPSRQEAFGIAAVEFMRMKVPIIVSPNGALPELVQNEQTGIVLQSLTPADISAAIEKLAHDKNLRDMLADKAEVFSQKFDGQQQIKQLENIYISLMQ